MPQNVSTIPIQSQSAGFYNGLRKEVFSFLQKNSLSQIDAKGLILKATIVYLLWGIFYGAFLYTAMHYAWYSLFLIPAMAFSIICIVLSVMHDGSHNAFSNSSLLNKLAAYSLMFAGASPILWYKLHVRAHHDNTNVSGYDQDFEAGGLLRLHPAQPRKNIYRFQHIYAWPLYLGHSLKWIWRDDFHDFFTDRWKLSLNEKIKVAIELIVSRLWHISIFIALPYLASGSWQLTLTFYLVHWMIVSIALVLVFAMAHLSNVQAMPADKSPTTPDWALHQLATTANFAPYNKPLSWVIGGLNFQIEHHIFPKISHTRYPLISPVVKRYCEKHNIVYNEFKSFRAVIAGHYHHLRFFGRKEKIPIEKLLEN